MRPGFLTPNSPGIFLYNDSEFREGKTPMYGRFKDHLEAKLRQDFANALLEEGIYVIGFYYPVVPVGKSRIRVQISAAHTAEQIDFAIEKFRKVGTKLGAI
jgi:nucleoside-triphosphatase THEP1